LALKALSRSRALLSFYYHLGQQLPVSFGLFQLVDFGALLLMLCESAAILGRARKLALQHIAVRWQSLTSTSADWYWRESKPWADGG